MKPMNKMLLLVTLLLVAAPIKSADDYWDPSSGSESESDNDNELSVVIDATLLKGYDSLKGGDPLGDDDVLLSGKITILDLDTTSTIGDLLSEIQNNDELIEATPSGYSLFVTKLEIDGIDYATNQDNDTLINTIFEAAQWQDGKWEFDTASWSWDTPSHDVSYVQRKKVKAIVEAHIIRGS